MGGAAIKTYKKPDEQENMEVCHETSDKQSSVGMTNAENQRPMMSFFYSAITSTDVLDIKRKRIGYSTIGISPIGGINVRIFIRKYEWL